MDKRVEIYGTSRADMNGKRGVAVDFHINREDPTQDRYTVQLDGGGERHRTLSLKRDCAGIGGDACWSGELERRRRGGRDHDRYAEA